MEQRRRFVRRVIPGAGSLAFVAALAGTATLTVSDSSTSVTGTSSTTLNFPVSRTGDTTRDAYVVYQTVDGTAVAPTNYTATSGALKIAAGATSGVIPITVSGSSTQQPDKTFSVQLTPLSIGPSPSFATVMNFSTGSGTQPLDVAIADFNGDGMADVATANGNTPGSVSVLLNTAAPGASTPAFAAPQAISTDVGSTTHPDGITTADINGDGKPDIIASNNGGTLAVLLNSTTPGASSVSFYPVQGFAVGGSDGHVVAADINGDGKPDLIVVDTAANTVSVLVNTTTPGSSTASFAARASFTTGNNPFDVKAADVNGDGLVDLIVANINSNSVAILLNTTAPGATTATFSAPQTIPVQAPSQVFVADLNADGKPDIVTDTGYALVNNTAAGATTVSFSTKQLMIGVAALTDMNDDGGPDVVGNNGSVYLNLTAPGSSTVRLASPVTVGTGLEGYKVMGGDFNGDGKPDLVAANGTNVAVSFNTTSLPAGASELSPAQALSTGAGTLPYGLATADFNGDGRRDLVVTNSAAQTVSLYLNTTAPAATTATFSNPQTFGTSGTATFGAATADFNGDGKPDVALAKEPGIVEILLNGTTAGAGAASFSAQSPLSVGSHPRSIAVADLDEDGKPDLVVSSSSSAVSVLINTTSTGSSVTSFSTQQTFATGANESAVAIADLNGDGLPDVVTANSNDGTLSVLLNMGPAPPHCAPLGGGCSVGGGFGGLAAQQTFTVGTQPADVMAMDLNGDGRPDLIAANSGSNTVSVLINTTSPGATTVSFAPPQTFAVGTTPDGISVADLNADGLPDLIVSNNASGSLSVLVNAMTPGATTAQFAAAQSVAVGSGPVRVTGIDLNGDGKRDVVVANGGATTASVLLNARQAVTVNSSATGTIHYAVPTVSLSPGSLALGYMLVNMTSRDYNVTVTNSGGGTLNVTHLAISGTQEFALGSVFTCSNPLGPGESCQIPVEFSPVANASRNASLVITTNAPTGQTNVPLSGTGATNNGFIQFGNETVGATSSALGVAYQNVGSGTISVGSPAIYSDSVDDFGQVSSEFRIISNTCGGSLAPGASCQIFFTFHPRVTGDRYGILIIPSTAPSNPDGFLLSGTGVSASGGGGGASGGSGGGGGALGLDAIALLFAIGLGRRVRKSNPATWD